jgi:hypothetical protein
MRKKKPKKESGESTRATVQEEMAKPHGKVRTRRGIEAIRWANHAGQACVTSTLSKTEQTLISHLSSIVLKGGSPSRMPHLRADRTGDSEYGVHVTADSGRSPL